MRKVANLPTNKKDRLIFYKLTLEQQELIRDEIENNLYDGTRTLALCWKLALDKVLNENNNARS